MSEEAIEKLHLLQKLKQEEIDFAKEIAKAKKCYSDCLKAAMSNYGWKLEPTKGHFILKKAFIDVDILDRIANPQEGEILVKAGFIDQKVWNLAQYAFLSMPLLVRLGGAFAAAFR